MRLGRLFFAGAVLLGLAWFALRSPVPAADFRFIKEDFPDASAPLSISTYLDTGYPRDRAHTAIAEAAAPLRSMSASVDAATRGAAVDAAAARLTGAGIANATVRYGSTLVTRGKRGNAPWRTGLRRPGGAPDDAIAYLLGDGSEAIASAGDARVVTVIAPDASVAAAAAQQLLAAGAGWRELARKQGLEQVLVADASGTVAVTPELHKRLKFLHGITPEVAR